MLELSKINECIEKVPKSVYSYGVNESSPFVFLDFEVFKYDWLLCYSVNGITIKTIINDANTLRNVFLNKLSNRILIAYNGNNYDKYIMLAILNGIDPKEVNDHIIHDNDFKFWQVYGDQIVVGKDLFWYDPASRLGGSLKTYEACQGENIYESEIDFDIDRKLTESEINETKSYCSFDVTQLVKYFIIENFDSFLGHVGLIDQTISARPNISFSYALPKTDASLVGIYLCSNKLEDVLSPVEVITLPDNIILGKYEKQILKLLEIPIKTLKNGSYNGLNSWSLKIIDKSINRGQSTETLEKLQKKETKIIEKIKKLKTEHQKLIAKSKVTEKQQQKINEFPDKMEKEKKNLMLIRSDIADEIKLLEDCKDILNQMSEYEQDFMNPLYNKLLAALLKLTKVTDNAKLNKLIRYLHNNTQTDLEKYAYKVNKKDCDYNDILLEYPFEVRLDIKGVCHLFKTGGIHSVAGKPMFFDKNTEHDKNRRLLIADVGSLYPNLMRVFNLCSRAMDDPNAFAQMIFDRIKLKKAGDPFAGVLKLILNTTYGCMGAVYNELYDPANRLKVCIYGEAAIVDLLDKLETQIAGLEIFQSNTDGIIISCEDHEYDDVERIIHEWEARTGLEMEIDESLYLAQKDVSNYILIEK